jgi:hypothetical protein
MSELQTDTNVIPIESDRVKYNKRIRNKRRKGHSLKMIAEYVLQCPVPFDQLDLTPEELAEMKREHIEQIEGHRKNALKNIVDYVLKCPLPIDMLELRPEELVGIEVEIERRKAETKRKEDEEAQRRERGRIALEPQLEAIATKVKAASPENVVQLDTLPSRHVSSGTTVLDELVAAGVLTVALSFKPREGRLKWQVKAVTDDYRVWTAGSRWLSDDWQKASESLQSALWHVESATGDWLNSKFPGAEKTLLGKVLFHVPTKAGVLYDYKHLPDLSTEEGLFDVLAQHGVATVKVGYSIESWKDWGEWHRSISIGDGKMLNAKGEEIDLHVDDTDLKDAINAAIEAQGEQAINDEEGYASYGGDDWVTFDVVKREVSVSVEGLDYDEPDDD